MRRPAPVFLFVLLLAACTSTAAPSPSVVKGPPSPAATPEATPSDEAVEPSPDAAPTWSGHPAEGLALVRATDPATGITQINIVEADGGARQVTGVSGALGASHPVWSPDGSQLAFGGSKVGEVGIRGQVAIVNADGGGERQLGEGQFPAWSPDGTRIAFTEVDDVTGEELSMYVVDVASGEVTDLGIGYQARWLDDDRLVFNANEFAPNGEATSVMLFMALGTGERERVADWTTGYPSPDRSKLLLVHEGVVSLADPDATNPVELANGADPVWSPDGSLVALAYAHDEQANPVHAVVDLEGRTVASEIIGATPTWSPDSTRLALEVYRPEGSVIQVVEVATGEIVWEEEGMQPAWRP